MKRKSIIMAVVFFISAPSYGLECEKNITEGKAIEIAEVFLSKQQWRTQFHKKAERISISDCKWVVWFKDVRWKEIKPSRGKVSVSMETGNVVWLPSR